MRGMKKSLCFLGACLLCLGLTSCAAAEQDAFQVQIICKSSGIQQIFWSCYLDGVFYRSGGMADLDGEELTAESELVPCFSRAYLDGADPIGFSIDFSPYAEGRIIPLGTTDQVSIPAQYGACYTVILSGDEATGFQAELQ